MHRTLSCIGTVVGWDERRCPCKIRFVQNNWLNKLICRYVAGDASLALVCKSCLLDSTKIDGLCQKGYKDSSSWAKKQSLNPNYKVCINRGNKGVGGRGTCLRCAEKNVNLRYSDTLANGERVHKSQGKGIKKGLCLPILWKPLQGE